MQNSEPLSTNHLLLHMKAFKPSSLTLAAPERTMASLLNTMFVVDLTVELTIDGKDEEYEVDEKLDSRADLA